MGIVIAAPSEEANMLDMNFDLFKGGIQTAAFGRIAGHVKPVQTNENLIREMRL